MKSIQQNTQLTKLSISESIQFSGGNIGFPKFPISFFLDWFKASSEGSIETIEPDQEDTGFGGFGGGSFGGGGSGGSW